MLNEFLYSFFNFFVVLLILDLALSILRNTMRIFKASVDPKANIFRRWL